jgi:hypothetical protein
MLLNVIKEFAYTFYRFGKAFKPESSRIVEVFS